MNIANDGAQYGADQYRLARNFELEDKTFVLHGPDSQYVLSLNSRGKAAFQSDGGIENTDCECLKMDKDIWFVRFGQNLAVIELNQGLATLVLPTGHVFCTIGLPEQSSAEKRHGYTDEMTGTAVRWVLGAGRFTDHIYISADQCRTSWSPKETEFQEYAAKYIKIKDGAYLVDIDASAPESTAAPAGCSRVVALEDFEHVMLAGCAFTSAGPLMISGYGEFPA